MRTLPTAGQPAILQQRDRARDEAQATRTDAWSAYVRVVDAAAKPLMRAALALTPGGRQAMKDLTAIMQASDGPAETLGKLEAWGKANDRTLGTLAWSGEAISGHLRLTTMALPRLVRAQAEFERADQALSRALGAAG